MNRREILGIAGAFSALAMTSQAKEPSPKEVDPWVGDYFKYGRYDTGRIGQFGEAQTITISKDGDGYRLSKPFSDALFTEKTKGVLSDREGGLGKIYLGTAEYADGRKDSILRVEFCYEDFVLYREVANGKANDENTKPPQRDEK